MTASERRINAILGDDNGRTDENACRYLDHLRRNLKLPLRVTGTEDFPWEEPYVFGGWSQAEYRRLKRPSLHLRTRLISWRSPNRKMRKIWSPKFAAFRIIGCFRS